MNDFTQIFSDISYATRRPSIWERSCLPFWDDPYISGQMLAAHLDPAHDAASRRPEIIERSVAWMLETLDLQPGKHLLDLGCGPGLYCRRFAAAGLQVTGVDYSQRSLEYAIADAEQRQLSIDYRRLNYLELDEPERFDVVSLIYFDLGALTDTEREQSLPRVWRALKPGGKFVFDVWAPAHFADLVEARSWDFNPSGGFWHGEPYLALREVFRFAETMVELSQYTILTSGGEMRTYRVWERSFSPETITTLLRAHGFTVAGCWGDLAGTPWTSSAKSMGIVAEKS